MNNNANVREAIRRSLGEAPRNNNNANTLAALRLSLANANSNNNNANVREAMRLSRKNKNNANAKRRTRFAEERRLRQEQNAAYEAGLVANTAAAANRASGAAAANRASGAAAAAANENFSQILPSNYAASAKAKPVNASKPVGLRNSNINSLIREYSTLPEKQVRQIVSRKGNMNTTRRLLNSAKRYARV